MIGENATLLGRLGRMLALLTPEVPVSITM